MDILLFAVKNFAAFFSAGTNSHHSSRAVVILTPMTGGSRALGKTRLQVTFRWWPTELQESPCVVPKWTKQKQ